MNPLSCATALAFALTCAASVAVAGETHLSPSTNGGRGALPSGYSALHFTQGNGDGQHSCPSRRRRAAGIASY